MDGVIPEGRRAPLLFEALPDLARQVPWTPLAHVPTAVEPCDALAKSIDIPHVTVNFVEHVAHGTNLTFPDNVCKVSCKRYQAWQLLRLFLGSHMRQTIPAGIWRRHLPCGNVCGHE